MLNLGTREECFNRDNEEIIANENLFEIPLSANVKIGRFTIIPECRLNVFFDKILIKDPINVDTQNNMASFLFATVYSLKFKNSKRT